MIDTQSDQDITKITLTPNRSSSMRQTRVLIIAISSIIFIIGFGWSLMGAFLILPFAGIDIALFAYFMHKVCNSTYEKQVITIDKNKILVQSGKHSVERSTTFERPSAYIVVVEPEIPSEPFELNLTDSKSRFELGPFLSQNDKAETRKILQQAGLREINEKWWLPTP